METISSSDASFLGRRAGRRRLGGQARSRFRGSRAPAFALSGAHALPECEAITPEIPASPKEFAFADDDQPDTNAINSKMIGDRMRSAARQASLDPDDGLQL